MGVTASSRTARRKAWLFIVAAVILFQASDVSLRVASVSTHYAVGAILQSIPLMLVALVAALKQRRSLHVKIPMRGWIAAAGYGFLQFLAGNVMFYLAVQLGGLSIASPAVQSQAIWAVLLGGLFLRETISRTMIGGIGLFVVGLTVMFMYKSVGTALSSEWIWAFVFGILGGLSWASASAVQKRQLHKGMPLAYVLLAGTTSGIALLNLLLFLGYDGVSVWANVSPVGAIRILAAGCFSGLAIWSISHALRTIEISKAIPVVSLSIVLNTVIGGVYFGEYLNIGSVCGMLIAFLGVVVVQEPRWLVRR